ncbi:MAG: ribosome silencing factor [bacterium]
MKKKKKTVNKAINKKVKKSNKKKAKVVIKKKLKTVKNKAKLVKKVIAKVKAIVKSQVVLPQQVDWIVRCLYDKKSQDIKLFDVSKTAGLWEYYVLCSGASSVHVSALRDNLKKEMGLKGLLKSYEDRDPENKWIVVDFGNILVHIFEKETRALFELEKTLGATEVSLKGIIKG